MSINSEGKELYKETRRIIRDAKENGRLVLFVGAGVSADPGIPLWSQAIKQIASKLPLTENDKPYDSLKIPQYYYNSRGKKEYTQLMREIFQHGVPLKTTVLHKKIIECQAETIITTNYDHLIEQAAEENAEVRYVISKDADLPYKNSSRELIKMHGDFENDNFVLKEDDYLHYSTNFKLIETYIKSLIGSKVVLFVGYSLNDPDVKQILTWVKDVLQDDFQRAYLILAQKEKNEIEREYFKHLGVNIIYTSEIVNAREENLSHTDELVEFFDYILEKEDEKLLDKVYKELRPLQDLNYVYGKYIRHALRDIYISCEDAEIDLSCQTTYVKNAEIDNFKKILWHYLKSDRIPKKYKIDEWDQNKLKTIKNVLVKSSFKSAYRIEDEKKHIIDLQDNTQDSFDNLVYMFDYKGLTDLKNKNAISLSSDTPKLYMQQAFICSLLNEYYAAYNCLKNASKIFYRNKDFTWYFLAEFNRKYVGQVCMQPLVIPSFTEDDRIQLETEVKAIDITQILETIPSLGHNHNQYLRELSNFKIVDTLFFEMSADSIKAIEQAKTAYSLFTGMAAYEKLRSSAQDYYNYETYNYIILDRYSEVRSIFLLYLRSIISSVMAEDISDSLNNEDTFSTGNIKQESLSSFDFYIILRYLSHSDLKKLFKEYEVKVLPACDEAIKYIEDIADSMFEAKDYIKKTIYTHDMFWVYLELISHLDISESLAQKILKHLSILQNEIDLINNRDCINRFIIHLCNEKYYRSIGIAESAAAIIDIIFDFLIKDSSNQMHFITMINNLLYVCLQSGNAYCDSERIVQLAKKCKKIFWAKIYSNIGSETQTPILDLFKNWDPEANASDYCLYCDAVLSNILLPNKNTEKKIYDWVRNSVKENDKEEKTYIKVFSKPLDYSAVIEGLVNLYLNEQIMNVDELREIIDLVGDPMSQWLLNMDEYDYSQFDCNWLSICRPGLLRSISQNEIARKNILFAYQKQYESKAVLSNINEIIIKYFITEPGLVEK